MTAPDDLKDWPFPEPPREVLDAAPKEADRPPVDYMAGVQRNGQMILTMRVFEHDGGYDVLRIYPNSAPDERLARVGTEEEARIRANWFLAGYYTGHDEAHGYVSTPAEQPTKQETTPAPRKRGSRPKK